MTTAHFPRLLLAASLFASFASFASVTGCDSGEKKAGLPPAKAEGTAAPAIPGPPPKPQAGTDATGPTAAAVASTANRYVATALPKHSAELGPKMSGTLTAVMVEEGDRVKKGQILFRLDSRGTRLGVDQAAAALQGAAISRDNAQRELDRQKTLAEKGTISAAVLERAEATYTASLNGVSQAEVMLSMAKRSTTDSSVSAPFDGIVARKGKSVGETVTMMPPTTVLLIQDHSTIELRTRIPETTLKQVKEGDTITAYFTAVEATREAKVVRIQPTVDPMTRTIEIVADVLNKDNLLRPGMYVEVELKPPSGAGPPPKDPKATTPAATAASSAAPTTKGPLASAKKPAVTKETP